MQVTTIGIDLAKRVFHLVALSAAGHEVWRKKLGRAQVLPRLAQVPACTVAMESCSGAHFWGREIEKLGHSVRLLAPQHVRVYVKGNKNDFNDAEAIAEAATRPRMGFVPLKSIEQQDIQALHRVRAALVKHRTALVNQWRGLLAEYGIVLPVGIRPSSVRRLGSLKMQSILSAISCGGCYIDSLRDCTLWKKRLQDLNASSKRPCKPMPARRCSCASSPALVFSRPPRWWAPLAMGASSAEGASWRPGWGWCPANTAPVASRGYWASVNGGMCTYARCSSMGHAPWYTMQLEKTTLSPSG